MPPETPQNQPNIIPPAESVPPAPPSPPPPPPLQTPPTPTPSVPAPAIQTPMQGVVPPTMSVPQMPQPPVPPPQNTVPTIPVMQVPKPLMPEPPVMPTIQTSAPITEVMPGAPQSYVAENSVSHTLIYSLVGLAVVSVIAVFGYFYYLYTTAPVHQPVVLTPDEPVLRPPATSTLGGSAYTYVSNEGNPLNNAAASVNPFDTGYQNPFSQ